MHNFRGLRILCVALILFITNLSAIGQINLPVTATFSNVNATSVGMPTGFSQSGLGGYNGSLKFSVVGSWLQLYFNGMPGALTFDLGYNGSFINPLLATVTITVQESSDGLSWTDVSSYSNVVSGTKSITTLKTSSRYVRWYFTAKTSGNIALRNITLSANPNSPFITLTPSTLNSFTYIMTHGPSLEQNFTVSGVNLTSDISVTPPSDYEISTASGASFSATNPIILTQSGGIVNNTTIYARLKAGLISNTYNESITLSSTDANTQTLTYPGNVTPVPTITITDVTDPVMDAPVGNSMTETINLSAVNLSQSVGLSISGTDAALFSVSQTEIPLANNSVPNTVVNITYAPLTSGNHTATLTMSSLGAMDVTRTLHGVATVVTGLNSTESLLVVTALNGNVLFTTNDNEVVDIYDSIGQKLVHQMTVNGLNTIPISAHGVVIVKVGSKISKVIL